ncbi:hypothetical protein [Streptomyces sp. GQFP]|uniref:hypothetical protein n=1 Tax=Streptomyces sp. GQFP TaxID=2907545 RepID=UPI001F253E2A|nr:hypothetical protein [Streptomyces sp. GQFP]UIX30843.1 hypothetical protein LUX31_12845 [Streptomyces sp. GQFP]
MSTDIDEVETWLEGRELLGRAVGGVSAPTGAGTEAVFARAARVRRRRWSAVTVVAAAGVAAGVVAGPGWLTYDEGGGGAANTGTIKPPGRATALAAEFAKLLPPGVGAIREVDMDYVLFREPEHSEAGPFGKYYGSYTVTRDGGVGYLRVINGFSKVRSPSWKSPCSLPGKEDGQECTFERLPNGNVLEVRKGWKHGSVFMDNRRTWGEYLMATLYLKTGGTVEVHDTTGFTGRYSLGPLLRTAPLTKSQLRELALTPELLKTRSN